MYAIIIGASNESIYAINQAKKLGMKVLAFDGNKNAEGLKYADKFFVVDIRNPKNIYMILEEMKVTKNKMIVVPVPIGRYLISSGAINERYNLIGAKKDTTEICTDKWLFHQVLNKTGLRNVNCYLLPKSEKTHLNYYFPIIVKPRYGSGSREVLKIVNEKEWANFYRNMPYNEDFIIEDFIEGTEYGIDGMVINGKFYLILVRKKLMSNSPYRQCIGYLSINNKENANLVAILDKFMVQLVKKVNLKDGIIHADIIYSNDKPFVIEMSARPSGHKLHNLFTPMVSGVDMIYEFLNYAQTGKITIKVKNQDSIYLLRFFDIESKIKNIPNPDYLKKKYSIIKYECNLRIGEIKTIKDGSSLIKRGFFIIKGISENEVCNIAKDILQEFSLTEK